MLNGLSFISFGHIEKGGIQWGNSRVSDLFFEFQRVIGRNKNSQMGWIEWLLDPLG